MLSNNNTYYLQKTKQVCHLLPWIAETACPWSPNYARILIPRPNGKSIVQVVRSSKLQVARDHNIPQGRWIHLTH